MAKTQKIAPACTALHGNAPVKILHVDITLPSADREHPIELGASFCGCKHTGEQKLDFAQRAKAALAVQLFAHHQSGYCDAAFSLNDDEFMTTMERIRTFRIIRKYHVIDCNCDEFYGACLASAEEWEKFSATTTA